jgi:hypothetical protein
MKLKLAIVSVIPIFVVVTGGHVELQGETSLQ